MELRLMCSREHKTRFKSGRSTLLVLFLLEAGECFRHARQVWHKNQPNPPDNLIALSRLALKVADDQSRVRRVPQEKLTQLELSISSVDDDQCLDRLAEEEAQATPCTGSL